MYRIFFQEDGEWVTEGTWLGLDGELNQFETIQEAQQGVVELLETDPFFPYLYGIGYEWKDGNVTMLQTATIE